MIKSSETVVIASAETSDLLVYWD